MKLTQHLYALLRWELNYWTRRITRKFRRRFRNFIRYTLVDLLVILGFTGLFVLLWAFCFMR